MFTSFDISLLIPGMLVEAETLKKKSLGGSESAGLYMARALAKQGASVSVFCNTNMLWVDRDGARYLPADSWSDFVRGTPHDVCVVQRMPEAFAHRTSARLNLLWCHDLALGRQKQAFNETLWNVDRTLVLSGFMRDQYREVYGLDDDALLLTRNGVDASLFDELRAEGIPRDPKKLMFCARPERGLDLLLRHVMPSLLARDRELKLYVTSYDLNASGLEQFYAECDALSARLGDRVVRLPPLSKRELYRHYLSARVYLYPTPSPLFASFREVSCITAMECQAAGLPMVTSALGALPETIAAGAGVLIRADPSQAGALSAYLDEFTRAVLELVNDDAAFEAASRCGVDAASRLDWSSVARDWLADFERLIRAGNSSPARLVRHFVRTSDVVPARYALSRCGAEPELASAPGATSSSQVVDVVKELSELVSPGAFLNAAADSRLQHAALHTDEAAEAGACHARELEPHLALLEAWFARQGEQIGSVLDFASADGACAIGLAQRFEHLRVHGLSSDPAAVELARAWAAELGLADRVTFSSSLQPAGAGGEGQAWPLGSYDCVLLEQALASVAEPWSLLGQVEQYVRPGGKVHLSVPFGIWESRAERRDGKLRQLWQLDAHDLTDMLAGKPQLGIDPVFLGDDPLSGEARGSWSVSYTVDHRPIPPIDLERHLWLQRPRQSVSAAIIAGPDAEETLHWSLRSLRDIVDEIVIADCGMSEEALRIACQYEPRIVPGVDPRVHGFERARNLALDAASCDWCLWLDTDEKLLGGAALTKYLRDNTYHAYGISQHHYSCDANIPPDTPSRLFRRRPYHGRSVRFRGAIHEHPSLAVNEGPGPGTVLRDVHIAHVGYLTENARRERFARNWPLLKLDQKRYPDRLLQKHLLMRDTLQLVRYTLEQSGGRFDDTLRAKCREIVDLYRKNFLGKRYAVKRASLEYCSQALALLGEGFEVALQVEADKAQAKTNGVQRYRYASSEDFCADLKAIASEKTEHLDSKWW